MRKIILYIIIVIVLYLILYKKYYENFTNSSNIFYPNSMIIPDTVNVFRNIKNKKRHIDEKDLDEFDLVQYDYKTLFFDCWIYNNKLTCIGPDLLNFYDELFPLKIIINNFR